MATMVEKKGFSSSSPEGSTYEDGSDVPVPSKRKSRTSTIVVSVLAVVVVLALALGLGLGLGLKREHSSSHQSSPAQSPSQNQTNSTSPTSSSLTSQTVPSWRRSTDDYLLDLQGWDFDAAPATRTYNFTLTEVDLAPDGKSTVRITRKREANRV